MVTSHQPMRTDAAALSALQNELAALTPEPWLLVDGLRAGGCFVCFGRGGAGPGSAGDRGWAAAVVMEGRRVVHAAVIEGLAGAAYAPGLLAAREGGLLAEAVQALPHPPDLLLVNATGRDHPRRAGLALHLGWALDLPSIGVTHRPLVAAGDPPGSAAGAAAPLWLDGEPVGWWLRTRAGARPLAVSPGWRTDLATARDVVAAAAHGARTPEPIRSARRLARRARAAAGGSG